VPILPQFAFTPTFVWSLIGANLILFIPLLLVIVLTFGVTIPFLKARLFGRHIVALVLKNGNLKFVPAKYKAGSSTAETSTYGDFYLVSDGIYRGAGTTISISFESYGVNLSGDLIVGSNKLKHDGFENYQDVQDAFENLTDKRGDLDVPKTERKE